MAYTRQNLIDEALANLGIVQKTPAVGAGVQTRDALVKQVLFNLGVLSDGRDASDGEVKSVTDILGPLTAGLSADSIVDIADTNAIPNQYFLAFAEIVADELKDVYGIEKEEEQRVISEAMAARRKLKNLTRTFIVERHLDAIYADLATRDIVVLIDDSAIPDEWFTHLAWITADICKTKGFELDPAIVQTAAAEGQNAIAKLRELTRGRPSYNTLRTPYM
jgi:hypothetical protein